MIFTIEILDERPVGFSVAVPELAIYTFGKTEKQAIERVLRHVVEKYEDLLNSPIPLNENEKQFLNLYRTKIIPALFEERLRHSPSPEVQRQFQHVLAEQTYFWEPELQAQEQAVDEALSQGEYKTFDSMEDMLGFLDQQ
jgi:hypothetical protein